MIQVIPSQSCVTITKALRSCFQITRTRLKAAAFKEIPLHLNKEDLLGGHPESLKAPKSYCSPGH